MLAFEAHSLDVSRHLLYSSGCVCSSTSDPLHSPASLLPRDPRSCLGLESCRKKPVFTAQDVMSCRRGVSPTALALFRGGETEGESLADSSTPRASEVLSYYLLWSPGLFRKTLLCILALFALRFATIPFQNQFVGFVSTSPFGFLLQVVMLPLLSSACCGIQLAINTLVGAGGCAGFNKYLGPLRPYFLAMLFVATTTSFPVRQSKKTIVRWIQFSMIRWSVALMPEIVHVWNTNVGERIQKRSAGRIGGGNIVATIEMTIPTMGCVACINKIDSSMRQCAPTQIEEAKSWLESSGKGGRALVRGFVSSEEEAKNLAEALVEAVRGAGFDSCLVDSIQTEENSDHD